MLHVSPPGRFFFVLLLFYTTGARFVQKLIVRQTHTHVVGIEAKTAHGDYYIDLKNRGKRLGYCFLPPARLQN